MSQPWLEAFTEVVPHITGDVIKKGVLPMALSKGRMSQPASSRLQCCQILGAIAQKFDEDG